MANQGIAINLTRPPAHLIPYVANQPTNQPDQ